LDRHRRLGNNVLLARELELESQGDFGVYKSVAIGVRGETSIGTSTLLDRARGFAARHGGTVRATPFDAARVTRRWAICTGAGASAESLEEAHARNIDTLIVGEGPHWTAVHASDTDLVILYAGHYATETLGVQALASDVARNFGATECFIPAPTGL